MNLATYFAHEGIEHHSSFEAEMHVLSQIIFVVAATVLAVMAIYWLIARRSRKAQSHVVKKDKQE